MKITLGGKISITLAFLCASIWTMLILVPEDARAAQQCGGLALYILAFPVGWLSGMFPTADGPPSLLYSYLLLTIPNSFLLGYSIAGVFYVLRRVCRFTHTKS